MNTLIIFCWISSIIFVGLFFFRTLYKALKRESKGKDNKRRRVSKKRKVSTLKLPNNVITEIEEEKGPPPIVVSAGATITMEYSMFDSGGNMLETIKGNPITYVQGTKESFKQVIPALQDKIVGLPCNKAVNIVLTPEEAYGDIDPDAFQEVEKEEIFTDHLEVGSILKGIGPQKKDARIDKVNESTVVLDFNHPFAGKALSFNIKILEIKNPARINK